MSKTTEPTGVAAVLPALLTLAHICQHFLPLNGRTIRRMVSAGTFPSADVKIGGKVRLWRRETVEEWIEEQAVAA